MSELKHRHYQDYRIIEIQLSYQTKPRTMYGLAGKTTQPYYHSVGTALIGGQTVGGLWNTDSREPEQTTKAGNAGKSNFCSSTQIEARFQSLIPVKKSPANVTGSVQNSMWTMTLVFIVNTSL